MMPMETQSNSKGSDGLASILREPPCITLSDFTHRPALQKSLLQPPFLEAAISAVRITAQALVDNGYYQTKPMKMQSTAL